MQDVGSREGGRRDPDGAGPKGAKKTKVKRMSGSPTQKGVPWAPWGPKLLFFGFRGQRHLLGFSGYFSDGEFCHSGPQHLALWQTLPLSQPIRVTWNGGGTRI